MAGAFGIVIASWSFGRWLVSQSVWKPYNSGTLLATPPKGGYFEKRGWSSKIGENSYYT